MVSNSAAASVTRLRQSVRDEVEATSLRHVSRQAGMSAAGLQEFLDGGQPYVATRRALERWFVLHGPGRHDSGVTADAAADALRVMVQDLSPARQGPMVARIVSTMEDAYRASGFPRPDWLEEFGRRAAPPS